MKVLDLHCGQGHAFEGWFASEGDFILQREKSMVQCPACGDSSVVKMLSAPRLNLTVGRSTAADVEPAGTATATVASTALAVEPDAALTAAWLTLARQIVAETTDVGARFAEEARKMHYQEADARPIRGTTTPEEAHALEDEGIEVSSFPMPQSLKETLQ